MIRVRTTHGEELLWYPHRTDFRKIAAPPSYEAPCVSLLAQGVLIFMVKYISMPYKIISPTGATVTKTLSEEEVEKLKKDKYFTLVSMQPKVFTGGSVCISCEG